MRQYLKGKRLISLCAQKSASVQRGMVRLNSDRKHLVEKIRQCEQEIATIEEVLRSLQFNDTSVTKADIYAQLKQQSLLLHQRQSVEFERTLYRENIDDIDRELTQCQKELAVIQRKEMKFTKWTSQGRRKWVMQQESVNEDEKLDLFPWIGS